MNFYAWFIVCSFAVVAGAANDAPIGVDEKEIDVANDAPQEVDENEIDLEAATNDEEVAVDDIDELSEVNDPRIKTEDLKEAIESALTGYDIVRGDPISVTKSGTYKDPGIKSRIFVYDPKKEPKVTVSVATGCSANKNSEVISSMGKFRAELTKDVKVAASVSGSGFGVSASAEFSASKSSNEIQEHISKNKGSLAIFTMTCGLKNLDVGTASNGLPPFTWRFDNFIKRKLQRVPKKVGGGEPTSQEKEAFKTLIRQYGTHYVSKTTIGARVTTTIFLSSAMTSSMSKKAIESCASASASVDYMGAIGGSVSASGCSASDRDSFNSNEKGVEKTIKNSYGTTKVAGDGTKFDIGQIEDPRPIEFTLSPILDLFTADGLEYGMPSLEEGRARELSDQIMSWLKPMFKTDNFQKYYCEAFKQEIPNCGKQVNKKTGCGVTDTCEMNQRCVNTPGVSPGFKCLAKCDWSDGRGFGGELIKNGDVTGEGCIKSCQEKSRQDPAIDGVLVKKNGDKGCWCQKGMLKSRYRWGAALSSQYKSCTFKTSRYVANECLQMDWDYNGHDAGSRITNTWRECLEACQKQHNCYGWTWASKYYSKDHPGTHHKCHFKDKNFLFGKKVLKGVVSGPSDCSAPWYCAVKKNGGIQAKTFSLKTAQKALQSMGSKSNPQGIIPMIGSRVGVAGDPNTLSYKWTGGSVWWNGWDGIHELRGMCENARPPRAGDEGVEAEPPIEIETD